MSETTSRFALPYLASNQTQKHVTLNEALRQLDGLVHIAVEGWETDTPPPSPTPDSAWHIGPAPIDDWAGYSGHIARYVEGAWSFTPATSGLGAWDINAQILRIYDGTAWQDATTGEAPETTAIFGINTTADETNRLAVKSNSVLLSHDETTSGSGNVEISVNKAAQAGSAEMIFKTGYSGRATFGLSGSDAFALKVSQNGSAWTQALHVDPADGDIVVRGVRAEGDLDVIGDTWRSARVTVASDSTFGQFKCRRARGTQAAPTAVQAGDLIFSFTPEGHDGSNYTIAGGLQFGAEDDLDVHRDTYFRIATVEDGTWREQVRVRANGNVGIGTTTPVTTLDINGPVRLKSHTLATLPAATGLAGALIYVGDATGGPVPTFSDGTDWRRCTDASIVD